LKRNTYLGELSAEFLGTFVILIFGLGVVASVLMSPKSAAGAGTDFFGNFLTINWAWGFGVALAIYVAGGVSGAHLNPAVTVALALRRGFPWKKVLPYSLAQVAGAFVAAALVRWNYWELFDKADPTKTKFAGVFSTAPKAELSVLGGFRSEMIGTAILVMIIFAIIDERNTAPLSNMAPVVIGFLIVAIGMSFGYLSGYAINPARDFGPRLLSYLAGWKTAWHHDAPGSYWWVPIVAPIVGGCIGALVYDFFIGVFVPVAKPEVGEEPMNPDDARPHSDIEREGYDEGSREPVGRTGPRESGEAGRGRAGAHESGQGLER
jgi:glycerol uptake facilitator protein